MIQNFQELVDCFWYWARRDGLTKLNTTIHYEKMYLMMLLNQILYNDMIIMVCSVLQIFIKMVENTSRCLFFPKLIGSSILLILVCSIIPATVGSPTNITKVRCDNFTKTVIIIISNLFNLFGPYTHRTNMTYHLP